MTNQIVVANVVNYNAIMKTKLLFGHLWLLLDEPQSGCIKPSHFCLL